MGAPFRVHVATSGVPPALMAVTMKNTFAPVLLVASATTTSGEKMIGLPTTAGCTTSKPPVPMWRLPVSSSASTVTV